MPSVNGLNLNTLSHCSSHSLLPLHRNTVVHVTDNIGFGYSDVSCDKVRSCFKTCGALMSAVCQGLVGFFGREIVVESIFRPIVQVRSVVLEMILALDIMGV